MLRRLSTGILTLALAGPLMAATPANPDPWQKMNRKVFAFNKQADLYVFKPVAKGYRAVMPQFLDDGITRFFLNLKEPLNAVNDGLQGKGRQALADLGRFTFNTISTLGFLDLAQDLGLPRREEDFGQTWGKWGIKSGPYVVIPFLGPSNVRDALSLPLDATLNPRNLIKDNAANLEAFALDKIDFRADLIPLEKVIEGDEYLLMRDLYLQRREFLVQDGKVHDDFMDDDAAEDGAP